MVELLLSEIYNQKQNNTVIFRFLVSLRILEDEIQGNPTRTDVNTL